MWPGPERHFPDLWRMRSRLSTQPPRQPDGAVDGDWGKASGARDHPNDPLPLAILFSLLYVTSVSRAFWLQPPPLLVCLLQSLIVSWSPFGGHSSSLFSVRRPPTSSTYRDPSHLRTPGVLCCFCSTRNVLDSFWILPPRWCGRRRCLLGARTTLGRPNSWVLTGDARKWLSDGRDEDRNAQTKKPEALKHHLFKLLHTGGQMEFERKVIWTVSIRRLTENFKKKKKRKKQQKATEVNDSTSLSDRSTAAYRLRKGWEQTAVSQKAGEENENENNGKEVANDRG